MVGGRACSMHRKRLISAPPDFETVTQRRIYTGAYGNLIPLKMAIKVELTLRGVKDFVFLPNFALMRPFFRVFLDFVVLITCPHESHEGF